MGDVVDILTRQSGTTASDAPGNPFLAKAEADGDYCLAAMLLFGEDLLWIIPDLPAKAIVAVASMVLLDQLRYDLPDHVVAALEVCGR